MISTRGVKFKFSAGEKVLCYEPDPTKAKVLYESKVLDLVANRDSRGRKVCEYRIHFYGWNSSWDRYVKEEFILPYTEENRELQTKLAEEAALSLKGKKKHKLPPLIKETLSKKMCAKNENQEAKEPISPPHSSSESESSDDEVEKEVIIDIPDVLKVVLEEDCLLITQKNKFINLPCQMNVIDVLESYVKIYAHKMFSGSALRNEKNGKKLTLEDIRNKLNLCKEAMDGLRIFFDFTLPHLLLYQQEKKQYYTIGTTCAPINSARRDVDEKPFSIEFWEQLWREYQPTELINDEMEFPPTEILETSTHFLALKHGLNLRNNLTPIDLMLNAFPEVNVKNVQSKAPQNQSSKEKTSKSSKVKSKTTTTRILRSSDKQKHQVSNDEPSPSVNSDKIENNCLSPKSSDCPPEPTSLPLRVTRQSGLSATLPPVQPHASPSSTSCDKFVPNSPTSSIPNIEHLLSQSASSNNCSSSNSSTRSTISNIFLEEHHHHLLKPDYASFVKELVYWKMVSDDLYEKIPAPPSLIYGPHHLLRLFVKLPALISKMSIKQKKLEILVEILENFLLYLADESHRLFLPDAYKDGKDIFPVGSLGML